ncbi:MAG: ATP-binding cassette domain-containing protein [[Eubacterium] rectale]|jgi:ABC-2 type transport system ATP-binding protein|uniref:ATP-binding cassette domain-containing protein n=3 Tax=Agathobacter rectalis TaxID=39491 RepID=A0A412RHD6_9FIRM|nr:ATP-binding cassette domain-containing protein [Agathobacter rectalis]MBD8920777.1 ATP-binding cassette domain-containing protein [Agathobacter rectalis]RGU21407.1 ATP-binding cassette domain-containing protein [Agathobacter rectalis]
MSEIVKVENVTKYFKQEKVLDDVNMNLETGHIYGIVGKNGAGKTVLFKIIAGFIKPSSGKVTVAGKIIGVDRDFPDSLGLIIETPGFLSQYNAYQNLLYLANINNKISKEDVKESIRMVGLDPGSNKKVGKFSLGMRQRLGIAQAIMENPNLIILDEPMNGLDKKGIEDVKELLLKLKGDGKTILMASHYAEDMEICDEVFQMEDGKLGDMKK